MNGSAGFLGSRSARWSSYMRPRYFCTCFLGELIRHGVAGRAGARRSRVLTACSASHRSVPDTTLFSRNIDKEVQVDMETATHGLIGIFWALNVLVVQKPTDDPFERSYHNGVASLIVAGETLTKAIADQF
jgi:hypothetical protein